MAGEDLCEVMVEQKPDMTDMTDIKPDAYLEKIRNYISRAFWGALLACSWTIKELE